MKSLEIGVEVWMYPFGCNTPCGTRIITFQVRGHSDPLQPLQLVAVVDVIIFGCQSSPLVDW